MEIDTTVVIEGVDLDDGDVNYHIAQADRRLAKADSMVLSEESDQAIIATIAANTPWSSRETNSATTVTSVHVEPTILGPFRDNPVSGQHFKSCDSCFAFYANKFSAHSGNVQPATGCGLLYWCTWRHCHDYHTKEWWNLYPNCPTMVTF